MMMIASNSRPRKGGKERREVKGQYGGMTIALNSRICKEEKERKLRRGGGNADYGEMVQPSQDYIAPCAKEVEWD